MRISITDEVVPEASRKGSLWDKWGVDGRTTWEDDLSAAHVATFHTVHADSNVQRAAHSHEMGHAETIENRTESDVMDDPTTYDRWSVEVEAWIRGMDMEGFDLRQGQLALDCLNSYRRSLGVTDADWQQAQRIIVDMATDSGTGIALALYTPLEPDPNDSPPDCGGEGGMSQPAQADDDEDGDDPDEDADADPDKGDNTDDDPEDGDDGDQDDDSDDEEPDTDADPEEGDDGDVQHGERTDPDDLKVNYDARWMRQDVLDALETSGDLTGTAIRFGLDQDRVPPLARALSN